MTMMMMGVLAFAGLVGDKESGRARTHGPTRLRG